MITKVDVKFIKQLATSRAERVECRLFIAEGQKIIDDLLAAGLTTKTVYQVGENISPSEMERISSLKTPTTALAIFNMPRFNAPRSPIAIALDGVQDPGNLGTIIRTADWFGINTIYCSTSSADVFAPKVVQATMGSLARVKVLYTDLSEVLVDEPIYGTFLERADNIYNIERPQRGIIVMGSEGNGISTDIEKLITNRIHIPRIGGGESLNVAIATAITLSVIAH